MLGDGTAFVNTRKKWGGRAGGQVRSRLNQCLAANDPWDGFLLLNPLPVNPVADIELLVDAYQFLEKVLSDHVVAANEVQFLFDGTG